MTARVVDGVLGDILAAMTLHGRHFFPFQDGIITLANVVYYFSVTAFFLDVGAQRPREPPVEALMTPAYSQAVALVVHPGRPRSSCLRRRAGLRRATTRCGRFWPRSPTFILLIATDSRPLLQKWSCGQRQKKKGTAGPAPGAMYERSWWPRLILYALIPLCIRR